MDDQRVRRHRIRIARPVRDLAVSTKFYEQVLELVQFGGFTGHAGYSGAFLGPIGSDWHIELTHHDSGQPEPVSSTEDLLVLYYQRDRMPMFLSKLELARIQTFTHENPYWQTVGASVFRDPDGYIIVVVPEHED